MSRSVCLGHKNIWGMRLMKYITHYIFRIKHPYIEAEYHYLSSIDWKQDYMALSHKQIWICFYTILNWCLLSSPMKIPSLFIQAKMWIFGNIKLVHRHFWNFLMSHVAQFDMLTHSDYYILINKIIFMLFPLFPKS